MRLAMSGFPTERTVVVQPMGTHTFIVRYRVKHRVFVNGEGLIWNFEFDEVQNGAS